MANIGLKIIGKLKQSRIGIGSWKVSTPYGLIGIGIAGYIASLLLAAIFKWFGLAIALIGVVLLFWPTDGNSKEA